MSQAYTAGEDIGAYLERHQKKELLRFLTCGSVDDGKSTLIGRLLHDTKMIYEDQLAAVKKDSIKHGTTGEGVIDLALLTDGLRAEREQGITIDVAYRYFSTDKRKFIIADTPGHEQYTRNMATGASNCQLGIILIDARYGVQTQTRRHTFICSLLGIKHLVVAVNKMDLVGWSEEVFEKIRADYTDFVGKLRAGGWPTTEDIVFIPMSALKGDNVVDRAVNMGWYGGPALLNHLETVHIAGDRNLEELRFPVQLVQRPNLDFRGFSGTIASGVVKVGDAVMALPSGKTSNVKSIETMDGKLDEAYSPMAVTITLEDEIDLSRGDMLVHADGEGTPTTSGDIDAMVVWMSERPLVPGKSYWIKQTTRTSGGSMVELQHSVDVNTLEKRRSGRLGLNEVGRVTLSLSTPLVFDAYGRNSATGAFIIIDRQSNNTVGAGMIAGAHGAGRHLRGRVSVAEKELRLGQKGVAVWVLREIVDDVERDLFEEARTVVRIDVAELAGEELATTARLLAEQGVIVLLAGERLPEAGTRRALEAQLGVRLVILEETEVRGVVEQLRRRGVWAWDESVGGGGI